MDNDWIDLAPNTGLVYESDVDEDLQREINEVKAKVQSARPLFNEILAWFDTELAWSQTIEGLNPESQVPMTAQVLAKQRLHDHLLESKARLVALRDAHTD